MYSDEPGRIADSRKTKDDHRAGVQREQALDCRGFDAADAGRDDPPPPQPPSLDVPMTSLTMACASSDIDLARLGLGPTAADQKDGLTLALFRFSASAPAALGDPQGAFSRGVEARPEPAKLCDGWTASRAARWNS